MIAIEIRNDELRAIRVSGLNSKKAGKTNSVPVDYDAMQNFRNGNIMAMVDILSELLLGMDLGDYRKEKYSVTINVEGIMAQKVQTPQVKDKEIIYAVSSALVRDTILISSENLVSYAVIKGTSKKAYDIHAYVTERTIAKAVLNLFDHLKLEVKQVDISPNTAIKAFNLSGYSKTDKPLSLIVDLSEEEVTYYQFRDKQFLFKYLDRIPTNISDSQYVDNFESNVYQFLDEFAEYKLQDLDIVLLGSDELINKITLNFEGIFYIRKFFDEFTLFDVADSKDINMYVNALGSLIRKDSGLSNTWKYDVNLLREIRDKQGKRNSSPIKNVVVIGTLASLAFIGWNVYNYNINKTLSDENAEIRAYVEGPEVRDELAKKEALVIELQIYDEALNYLTTIEDFLIKTKKPYTSRAYYAITQEVPLGSEVTSTTYRAGVVEINFESSKEKDFKEYIVTLSKNKLVESVEYSGFSSSGAGYQGKITIGLKGSED